MVEIEAKVPITRKEYQVLKRKLDKEAEPLGESFCRDSYFDRLKKATIRLRKRGGGQYFELKRRETREGIESNLELCWTVSDGPKWRAMLRHWGIRPTLRKLKRSLRYRKNDFIIELNHVRLLGYYLEIECLSEGGEGAAEAKRKLVRLFRSLGYSEEQFEARPYLELLDNV